MRFYVLNNVVGSSHETDGEKVNPNRGDTGYCPACGSPVGMLKWLPPFVARVQAYGKSLGDVAFCAGGDMLISEKLLDAWTREQLTGLQGLEPVDIVRVRPARLGATAPRYFHAVAKRSTTRIDDRRSIFVRRGEPPCKQCMRGAILDAIGGFSIDESTWSGDDFFEAENLGGVRIATERVLELRDKFNLTNMPLIPTEDYVWDPLHRLARKLS